MIGKTVLATVVVWGILSTVPALAVGNPDLLSFSVGQFDASLFGASKNMRKSTEVRLDYRWGTSLLSFTEPYVTVRPWIGVEANANRGVWGGAGLMFDVPLGKSLYLAPGFGIGGYSKGSSKDLGTPIEFRSTCEAGYRFESDIRIGAYVSHMSNAGIAEHNPGANALGMEISLPMGRMFGDR